MTLKFLSTSRHHRTNKLVGKQQLTLSWHIIPSSPKNERIADDNDCNDYDDDMTTATRIQWLYNMTTMMMAVLMLKTVMTSWSLSSKKVYRKWKRNCIQASTTPGSESTHGHILNVLLCSNDAKHRLMAQRHRLHETKPEQVKSPKHIFPSTFVRQVQQSQPKPQQFS